MKISVFILAQLAILSNLFQSTDLSKAPSFAEIVPNVTVTQGREAVLPCVVDNLGSYKVAWFQVERKQVLTVHTSIITTNYRVTLDHRDQKHFVLHIKNVQESDRGQYMCQINTRPMKKQIGLIKVVVPPKIDEYRTMSDVVALEGTDISLSCSAKGFPEPTIKWRREDDQNIPNTNIDGEVVKMKEVQGQELHIKRVSRLDMGAFLCMASNGVAPSVSHRIMLQVNFPPMLWIPHQRIGAAIGATVTLECHGEAYPNSINYWKNSSGEMITSDDHYSVMMITDDSFKTHMVLKIISIKHKDFGNFQCISQNPLGDTEGHLTLYQERRSDFYPGHDHMDNRLNSQDVIVIDEDQINDDSFMEENNEIPNDKIGMEHKAGKSLPTRTDLSKLESHRSIAESISTVSKTIKIPAILIPILIVIS